MERGLIPSSGDRRFVRRGSAFAKTDYYENRDLDKVLAELGPLPNEALLLGVATDGLPILLNLHDPVPGPILVLGDSGSGKTDLLKGVAKGIYKTHSSQEVQFVVVTNNTKEWSDVPDKSNLAALLDIEDPASSEIILSLAAWAHGNKSSRQAIVFMIDDISNFSKMDTDTQQNLRWLLLRGPSRRVWPIATGEAKKVLEMQSFTEAFATRLYGHTKSQDEQRQLGVLQSELHDLVPGIEFKLKEGDKWTRFWIPE